MVPALRGRAELRGERLTLRPLGPEDLRRTHLWVADPEIARWLLPAWPLLPRSWEEWLRRIYTAVDAVHFAVVLGDGRHIGNVGLHAIRWDEGVAELGIVLGERDCWGQGYGPEAVRLLLDYAFGDLGLAKVVLHVHRRNQRAIRAYRKVGFVETADPSWVRFLRPFGGTDILTMAVEAERWAGIPTA